MAGSFHGGARIVGHQRPRKVVAGSKLGMQRARLLGVRDGRSEVAQAQLLLAERDSGGSARHEHVGRNVREAQAVGSNERALRPRQPFAAVAEKKPGSRHLGGQLHT